MSIVPHLVSISVSNLIGNIFIFVIYNIFQLRNYILLPVVYYNHIFIARISVEKQVLGLMYPVGWKFYVKQRFKAFRFASCKMWRPLLYVTIIVRMLSLLANLTYNNAILIQMLRHIDWSYSKRITYKCYSYKCTLLCLYISSVLR